jgi:hypothetical protein
MTLDATDRKRRFAHDRREFLRKFGISAAVAPLAMGLPSLGFAATAALPKKRLILVNSPNGMIPWEYWPVKTGADFTLKRILAPFESLKDQLLILKGICNKIKGDGDRHMRGMSCALTGIELLPGNIQGGSDTPAGWASGISIDQEIARFLASDDATRTRFGSLEFGVQVPGRADPWTRWVYGGANKPIAPIDDPYEMFEKLYGRTTDRQTLQSVLDDVREDIRRIRKLVSMEDRHRLEEHAELVRSMEDELKRTASTARQIEPPELPEGVKNENDQMPQLSEMQMNLLVSALAGDMTRIATLQFTRSVGQARMSWLGIEENHHQLSHEPDSKKDAVEKLVKINVWFAKQVAFLARRLQERPESGGEGTMLDHTSIVWTNELGKGNNHTLDNIPFLVIGGGLDFKLGRALDYRGVPHNRLLLAYAHAFGHELASFGNPDLCKDGLLTDLA